MHAQSSVAVGMEGATKAMSAMNKVSNNIIKYIYILIFFYMLADMDPTHLCLQ